MIRAYAALDGCCIVVVWPKRERFCEEAGDLGTRSMQWARRKESCRVQAADEMGTWWRYAKVDSGELFGFI